LSYPEQGRDRPDDPAATLSNLMMEIGAKSSSPPNAERQIRRKPLLVQCFLVKTPLLKKKGFFFVK